MMVVTGLLDCVVSLSTSTDILRILDVLDPRPTRRTPAQWSPREERKVAAGHVLILGTEEEPRHDGELGVTVDDHCTQCRRTSVAIFLRPFTILIGYVDSVHPSVGLGRVEIRLMMIFFRTNWRRKYRHFIVTHCRSLPANTEHV